LTSKYLAKLVQFTIEKERIPTQFFLREFYFLFFSPPPSLGGMGGLKKKITEIFQVFSVGSVIVSFAVSSCI
jgi:hypothetical protein